MTFFNNRILLRTILIISLSIANFQPTNSYTKDDFVTFDAQKWGFYGHKMINRYAIFTLPPEMIVFYKHHVAFIESKSVNPDMRRYIMKDEAPRHYIDLDLFGDSAYSLPRFWNEAVEKYTEDTLMSRGIVPWHVQRVLYWLTLAFQKKDVESILRLSADLGHYIADAHVPLHTTANHNGQMTNQHGIHGFWESRLPELFGENYDRLVGKAEYCKRPHDVIWEAVLHAHRLLNTVFSEEINISQSIPANKKYAYEKRGNILVRTYSFEFSYKYHQSMEGMVEEQMKKAIKTLGDFWFTAWVNAGQPDLSSLIFQDFTETDTLMSEIPEAKFRNHESGEIVSADQNK